MLNISNKWVVRAISPSSCYPLLWCLHLCDNLLCKSTSSLQASARCITDLKGKLQVITTFIWTTSMSRREGIESCAFVWCVQLHCKLQWKPWEFIVSLFSYFPGLIPPHITYSFTRNSHVFPKAPHLETDAPLSPGLGVAVRVCTKHPHRTCLLSTLCPGTLQFPGSALDRLSPQAQCALLSLMHTGWKMSWLLLLTLSSSEKSSHKHGNIKSDPGLQSVGKSCIIVILIGLFWISLIITSSILHPFFIQ